MEVGHINRSSSATYHPKVYTGAKSEYDSLPRLLEVHLYYSNRTASHEGGESDMAAGAGRRTWCKSSRAASPFRLSLS